MGRTDDDISLESIQHLESLRDIVVTEKLDGENTTMYRDYLHARSLDSGAHPSRNWVERFHAQIRSDIPESFRICGENLYAKHSIFYDSLPSYFIMFGIYEGNTCLSWDETDDWCKLIGLKLAPVLYRGIWDEGRVKACWSGKSRFGSEQEGYVIRNAGAFSLDEFIENVAKFVRVNHVTSEEHWMDQELVPNTLAADK
jgi:hypothetical protein